MVSGNFLIDSDSRMRLAAAPAAPAVQAALERDPVCHMEVNPGAAGVHRAQHLGKSYYFCSPQCRTTFEKTPERYAGKQAAAVKGRT